MSKIINIRDKIYKEFLGKDISEEDIDDMINNEICLCGNGEFSEHGIVSDSGTHYYYVCTKCGLTYFKNQII